MTVVTLIHIIGKKYFEGLTFYSLLSIGYSLCYETCKMLIRSDREMTEMDFIAPLMNISSIQTTSKTSVLPPYIVKLTAPS